jgi:hypothetical protein
MMDRRPLSEMLTDVAEGVLAAHRPGAAVRADRIELTMPIEIRVLAGPSGPVLSGDLPLFRWRTDFDPRVGRLSVIWTAERTS